MSAARVVLIAALHQEIAPLRRRFDRVQGLTLVRCGVGLKRAEAAGDRHLPGASLLISTGCCGGLAPGARHGLLVAPRRLYVMDGAELREAPSPDGLYVDQVTRLAERMGMHCSDRPMLSVAQALFSPESKHKAHEQCGAVAVDMESAGLARAALRHRVPHLCLRMVLDSVEEHLPEPALFDADGQFVPRGLLRALSRPMGLVERASMALRLTRVSESGAAFIERLVEDLDL